MQTSDATETVTIEVHPVDYEAARSRLESFGYRLTNCETLPGRLRLTGQRQKCGCDLCQSREREDSK